jgi:hypothetical protein
MRFGTAHCEITPPFSTTMRGYSARKDTFDGVNDPLTFTAIVLEEGERRALLGAADLCGFPDDESMTSLLAQLGEEIGCPPDNVMLNASHTHGGPKVADGYRDWLYERVLMTIHEAASSMNEGTLWYGEGKTRLPMNRRLERDGKVANAPNPEGPVDDRMQLLVFRKPGGEVAAAGMKVSCHPVATGAQHLITADYPGAWRKAFSKAFGDSKVLPFFLQGAGADARPRHVADGDRWRAMKHAELFTIGDELLAEILAILTGLGLRQLKGLTLKGKINTVNAPKEAEEEAPDHEEFHVQTLWLNSELALIGLDAEPLCGLGQTVEAAVAPKQAMLLGYTNGCRAYAPDTQEMKRGGYETGGHFLPGLENLFAQAVGHCKMENAK